MCPQRHRLPLSPTLSSGYGGATSLAPPVPRTRPTPAFARAAIARSSLTPRPTGPRHAVVTQPISGESRRANSSPRSRGEPATRRDRVAWWPTGTVAALPSSTPQAARRARMWDSGTNPRAPLRERREDTIPRPAGRRRDSRAAGQRVRRAPPFVAGPSRRRRRPRRLTSPRPSAAD